MKVAALAHFATPWRNAGSETVMHLVLRELARAGHEVRFYVTACPGKSEMTYEGVRLVPVRNVALAIPALIRYAPAVTLTQHQDALTLMRYGSRLNTKTVYLTHNEMDVNQLPLKLGPDLVIHNTHWVAAELARKYGPPAASTVLHPPLDCVRHAVENAGPGGAVTLVNVNEHKGGTLLPKLAEAMPDIEFIAVEGGHGAQVRMPRMPNLTTVAHNPDMRPVWRRTSVLIAPSVYESYGLVGVEAGCSGIPVIANPTPGLRESLDDAGLFVPDPMNHYGLGGGVLTELERHRPVTRRDDVQAWATLIRQLRDPAFYAERSALAEANSAHLCQETASQLTTVRSEIEALCSLEGYSAHIGR